MPVLRPALANRADALTRLVALGLLAPLLALLSLPVAFRIARGPDLGMTVHECAVVAVAEGGPAADAGLQPGDRVVGLGQRLVSSPPEYYAALAGAARRDLAPLELLVQRGGATIVVHLQPARPTQAAQVRGYSLWVTGLAFLAIGWWVFLQRRDLVARNFFALSFIFAFFLVDIPDLPSIAYMHVKEVLRLLMQNLMPAYFLRFLLLFPAPDRREPSARVQWRQRLLLVPGLILAAVSGLLEVAGDAAAVPWLHRAVEAATLAYALSFFLAGLVVFGRRIVRPGRPVQRSKLLVVLGGLVVGLVPFLIATVLVTVAPASAGGPLQTLALSLVLVPVSFSLAIMRYGALDAAFVLRAGLIYGLLTLMLLGAFFLTVVGLGSLLSHVFDVAAYPVLLLIAAGSSLAIQPLRRVAQDWIDRTFYRRRSVRRRTFAALADELSGMIELDEAVACLATRLNELFRPGSLQVCLSPAADEPLTAWRPTPASAAPIDAGVSRDASLIRLLLRLRRPVTTEEVEDLLFAGDTDDVSLRLLTRLGDGLLLPLVSGNRLVGLIALGPKPGEAAYTQEDLANLRGLAVQVGSIIESRCLYRDVLRQERHDAELAVARDIQSRLLPTAPLSTPGWSVAGRNDPCRAVGGDYFDYFLREDGHLALAIADVAGKGVPAAILMAALATSLRLEGEGTTPPAVLVTTLNNRMGARITPGRFVSFFFADLDPESGLLRYCNAGMDPPLLLRSGEPVQHLRKGGPVLGVAPDHRYREGVLRLRAGDRVFLRTDGLADERSPDGDFFDEERLLALVAGAAATAPRDILDQVFAAVAAFGAGSESDDKTAILLQIHKLRDSLATGPLLATVSDGWGPLEAEGRG